MKKIMALLLSVITLALCLTGCVYEELGVKLNKDGTGSIETTIGLKKEFVKQLKELGGTDPFTDKETTEAEYDGETYIVFTETKEYKSFEEMEKALIELTFETNGIESAFPSQPVVEVSELSKNTELELDSVNTAEKAGSSVFKSVSIRKDGSSYIFDAVLNPVEGEVEGYDLSEVLKFKISYKNGQVDGKKVTFDISDLSEETELYAECKVSSPVPAFIGIGLAIAAVVAFFVLRKRK